MSVLVTLEQNNVDVEGQQYRCTVGYTGGQGSPAESFVTLLRKRNGVDSVDCKPHKPANKILCHVCFMRHTAKDRFFCFFVEYNYMNNAIKPFQGQ